jgi:hypothetical protein
MIQASHRAHRQHHHCSSLKRSNCESQVQSSSASQASSAATADPWRASVATDSGSGSGSRRDSRPVTDKCRESEVAFFNAPMHRGFLRTPGDSVPRPPEQPRIPADPPMQERPPCRRQRRFIPPERRTVAVVDAAKGVMGMEESQTVSPFQPRRIAPPSSDGPIILGAR